MIQPWTTIPLEPTVGRVTPYDGFTIVPIDTATTINDLSKSLNKVSQKLQRLKQLAPEARSQAKYQHTIDWLAKVRMDFISADLLN